MSDKLTPGMLRDLADLNEGHIERIGTHGYSNWAESLRDEAARREAEQKPRVYTAYKMGEQYPPDPSGLPSAVNLPEGLDSADAPLKLEAGKYYRTRDGRKVGPMAYSERPKKISWPYTAKIDDIDHYWRADGSWHPQREEDRLDLISEWVEDKPAPAADDLVQRLRGLFSLSLEARCVLEQAADRIEAQAREIDRLLNAMTTMTAVSVASEGGLRAERDTLKARVAELEADRETGYARALGDMNTAVAARLQAEAKAARLAGELQKAANAFRWYEQIHASKTPPDTDKAERNKAFADACEAALAEAGHAK